MESKGWVLPNKRILLALAKVDIGTPIKTAAVLDNGDFHPGLLAILTQYAAMSPQNREKVHEMYMSQMVAPSTMKKSKKRK